MTLIEWFEYACLAFLLGGLALFLGEDIYRDLKEDKRKARKKEKKRLKRLAHANSQT